MKILPRLFSLALIVLLSGCFQGKDELTLQPDGSGTVRLTFHFSLPEELFASLMGMGSRGAPVIYPPVTEGEARRFFPAKDFILKFDEASTNNGNAVTIVATFTNVNALLASPYGKAHQLTLKRDSASHTLVFQGISAGELLARAANFKPESEELGMELPTSQLNLEELQKKKNEMSFEFKVTLPNPITEASTNGAKSGKTVTWSAERAKCKDDDEFASGLSGVLEARCADTVTFSSATPSRMGLLPFSQLVAGKTADTVILPDSSKILAAARFVPYSLQVTRSLDLSGEGTSESMALLSGAVVLPTELAPQRWGEAKLEEALDAQGHSLMPKEQEDDRYGRFGRYRSYGSRSSLDDEADSDTDARPKVKSEKERMVTLAFKAPDWKVKQLARVKGKLELQYLGDPEIVKLTNAVSASLVINPRSLSGLIRSSRDKEPQKIEDARLSELSYELTVEGAVVQGGMTMLQLEAGSGIASLLDLQVFDAEGRPWPTLMPEPDSESSSESRSLEVVVAGTPKPPLSLGLMLSGVGTAVNVPLEVENVPLSAK